jgi:cysteine desulfuration protein SufE
MSIDEILENFALLDQWDDRYRYIIELGRSLPELPELARVEANKVQGCASQVWMETSVRPNGKAGPVLTFV